MATAMEIQLVTYCLEAQAMIECTVRIQLMLFSEVQAMTYYTEVMEEMTKKPINCTEKMEMMKFGPANLDQTKCLVVLVMTCSLLV